MPSILNPCAYCVLAHCVLRRVHGRPERVEDAGQEPRPRGESPSPPQAAGRGFCGASSPRSGRPWMAAYCLLRAALRVAGVLRELGRLPGCVMSLQPQPFARGQFLGSYDDVRSSSTHVDGASRVVSGCCWPMAVQRAARRAPWTATSSSWTSLASDMPRRERCVKQ